jgi:hypothetical protein
MRFIHGQLRKGYGFNGPSAANSPYGKVSCPANYLKGFQIIAFSCKI